MLVNWVAAVGALAAVVVVSAALGLIGLRWQPVRTFLVVIGPLYSVGILTYFLFEGTGSQCSGTGATFHCWEISYASTWGVYGSVLVGAVVVLTLAPFVAAWLHSRRPTVMAAALLAVLIGLYVLGLWPWVPAWGLVLAAGIAGPPSRGEKRTERSAARS